MTLSKRAWILRLTLVALILWPPFAWVAARGLIETSPIEKADAIAVLSGSATFRERTNRAAELYRNGLAPVVILTNDGGRSGWSRQSQRNPSFVDLARENLAAGGVPNDKIEIIRPLVDSTYLEVERLREYAVENGLHSIIFVTSAYHSRRTLWTVQQVFDGTGISIAVQTAPAGQDTPTAATWWLSGRGWRFVAAEWVKLLWYRIAY
ncbi:MAG: YdcF family protein [Candidatus Udaeobacter sp.]